MTAENGVRRRWWSSAADWPNWRLPVKLVAVLLVPLTVGVGAGILQIQGYVRQADTYASIGRLVTLRAGMGPLISGIQRERAFAAQRVDGAGVDAVRFPERVGVTDEAATAVRRLVERTTTLGEVAASRFRDAGAQLDGLPQLRGRVLAGNVDVSGGVAGYSVVLRALLDFDQALVGDFGDPALSGTGTALHNLAIAGEQVSWQHATVLAGISRGRLLEVESTVLEQSWIRLQDNLADYNAVATPDQRDEYRLTVQGPDVDARNRLAQAALAGPQPVVTPLSATVPIVEWNRSSEGTTALIESVLDRLEDELAVTAGRLQDETSNMAGVAAVILLAFLFVAGAVGFVVGSNLLRSLRALRVAALDVARHRLPAVVAQLRHDGASEIAVDPVPVYTTEELGQLARAFDAVHQQAVRSAVEEASLRGSLRNTFVNLSRRSQGLVERQLKLMEELERQEENPGQLANLFKLDHLATRMRRNNENLMVLSGSDVTRRFTRPVPLADVLRAGASEIEQYQRVVVQAAPQVEVVGYAASDLVRLIAELLDNATAFSPPRSQVLLGGRLRPGGGLLVDVVDHGVGMGGHELDAANRRLSAVDADDLPASRQMGLFVVARLAGRHGIEVRLVELGPDGEGVRAVVGLPPELVRVPAVGGITPPPVKEPVPPSSIDDGWSSFRGRTIEDQSFQPKPTWFAGMMVTTVGGADDRTGEPPRHRAEEESNVEGSIDVGSGGLPKRNPQGHLMEEHPGHVPARRDPDATRGFLANYQTGVRQGVQDSVEHRAGQENT